jgi:hypothetical protein
MPMLGLCRLSSRVVVCAEGSDPVRSA